MHDRRSEARHTIFALVLSRLYEWLYQFEPYLVVGATGLRGCYDFDLNFMQSRSRESSLVRQPHGYRADVDKARQPLGVKLELKRRSVEVLMIDHAEKIPTAN